MKIALIGTTLFHQGAEYVLATLARGLAAKGHEITVILSKYHEDWQNAHPDWKPFELPAKVKVVVQPKRRGRESVFTFRKIFKGGKYDVVMCHSGSFTYPLVLSVLGISPRPKIIHVEHASGVGTDADGHLIRPRFSFVQKIKYLLLQMTDAQFTVSQGTADAIHRMTSYPRDRIFTVYNPVVDGVFGEKVSQNARHPWLAKPDVPVVVAAGAFCSFKNHLFLFRAFAEVLKQREARLVIFGEGSLRGEYEKLIAELKLTDHVSLPGFTDNLPAELKGASCFVVSSTIESFSVVLVEALACGVPVVSTNCPYGPPEILKNGKFGVLVENNNVDAMAEGILKVLDGNGIKPTSDMIAPYTIETIVSRYEQAMQDVLEGRPSER